jgi:hypothetical protein
MFESPLTTGRKRGYVHLRILERPVDARLPAHFRKGLSVIGIALVVV